jgi:hypothetical protein
MEVYFSNADTAAAALMLAATACEVKVPKKRHAKVGVAHHPVCHLLMVHWRAEYLVSFAGTLNAFQINSPAEPSTTSHART